MKKQIVIESRNRLYDKKHKILVIWLKLNIHPSILKKLNIALQKNFSSSEWWRQSISLLNLADSNRIAETLQRNLSAVKLTRVSQ
jgi:hypothetical protein